MHISYCQWQYTSLPRTLVNMTYGTPSSSTAVTSQWSIHPLTRSSNSLLAVGEKSSLSTRVQQYMIYNNLKHDVWPWWPEWYTALPKITRLHQSGSEQPTGQKHWRQLMHFISYKNKKLSYRRETARQLHTSFSAHSLIVHFTEHRICFNFYN